MNGQLLYLYVALCSHPFITFIHVCAAVTLSELIHSFIYLFPVCIPFIGEYTATGSARCFVIHQQPYE